MGVAADTVLTFVDALNRRNFDDVMTVVGDDIVYDNVPLPTLHGADQFRAFLSDWTVRNDEIGIVIHNLWELGTTVIVERTDRDRHGESGWQCTRACGIFDVHDGKVTSWRDYYDINGFLEQSSTTLEAVIARAAGVAGSTEQDPVPTTFTPPDRDRDV